MFELPQQISDERLEYCHYSLGSWFAVLYFLAGILYGTSAAQHLPGFISMPFAGFVFCIGPGLALYSLISLRTRSHFSYMTLFVLSCSLGFTYNFLANVLVYVFHPSLPGVVAAYLLSVSSIYVFLLLYWKRKGITLFTSPGILGWQPKALLVVALSASAFVLFHKMPAGFYVEELVVLRKLFENHEITSTNIAFHVDERTTYYFVPFYLFLAMSAKFSGVDIIQSASGLWAFTTTVSLLCMVAISRLLIGHWPAIAAIIAMGIFHTLFLNQPTSNSLTVFAAFPDRYALAAGVLIPLALFHFLIHMGEKSINVPAFVGLVYLITEITFVHARETLFFIGIVLVCMSIMFFDVRRNRSDLLRIFWLLCIVAGILLIYRQMNLAYQPDLAGFIVRLKNHMAEHLRAAREQYGIGSLFGIPQFYGTTISDSFPYAYHFGQWSRNDGLGFVPIVVCLLPVYVLAVEKPAMLLAPAVIAALGLFSLFQGIRLAIGILVGAPFIFDIFSLLFIFAAIIFGDMARMVGAIFVAPYTTYRDFVFRVRVLILMGVFLFIEFKINLNTGYATGMPYLEMLAYLLTLLAVAGRAIQMRRDTNKCADGTETSHTLAEVKTTVPKPVSPSGMIGRYVLMSNKLRLAATAILVGLLAVGVGQIAGREHYAARQLPTGQLAEDYNALDEQHLFAVNARESFRLPAPIIQFIRHDTPPLQTWFGGHTLPILMISNQYAPILTFSGIMSEGFEANHIFLTRYYGKDPGEGDYTEGDFTDFLKSGADIRRLFTFLDELGVQWIITRPVEKARIENLMATNELLRNRLEQRFEAEGFKIFKLKPSN